MPGMKLEDDEELDLKDGAAEEEEDGDTDRGDELPEGAKSKDDDGEEEADESEKAKDEGEGAAGEGDETAGKKRGSSVVSHGRFNEVNESYKAERAARLALEEEVARLKGGAGKAADAKKDDEAKAFDFDAKEDAYMDAMMEGDKETAKKIRREINEALKAQAQEAAATEAETRITARQAQQQFSEAVADVIEAYPFLDAKSKAANADAIDLVVATRNQYIAAGKSPAQALMLAAQKVGPLFAPKKAAAKADEDDDSGEKQPKDKLDELRRARLARNAKAAGAQPAVPAAGVGERGTAARVDPTKMDEDEFRNLSAKEKAVLRGDAV